MNFILVIALFWVAPTVVAKKVGEGKGRTTSWVWGLLLGWLGVAVVAFQSPARAS